MNAREEICPRETQLAVMKLWQVSQTAYVPLSLGAAFALFELCAADSLEAPVSSFEYYGALNILAAALSSLIPLYAQKLDQKGPITVKFNPVAQRFEGGATVLRGSDGTYVTDLLLNRTDVLAALPAIERARPLLLPFRAKGRRR